MAMHSDPIPLVNLQLQYAAIRDEVNTRTVQNEHTGG